MLAPNMSADMSTRYPTFSCGGADVMAGCRYQSRPGQLHHTLTVLLVNTLSLSKSLMQPSIYAPPPCRVQVWLSDFRMSL